MTKLLLNGARGRMGQAIQAVAAEQGCEIAVALDVGDAPLADWRAAGIEAVIDFSHHDATVPLLEQAVAAGVACVIGTTGHTEAERARIEALARETAVVFAGNYSLGVNLLIYLTEIAARALDSSFQPEILEAHHRHKKDAPSGTAEHLIEAVREARALSREALRHGREGMAGPRPEQEIGVHAIRGGDIVGEHTVLFAGEGERVELTHRATDRAIFARGALTAAKWATSQKPGLYTMREVLQLGA
ncbi:MAG: 4-hydroxy-tetrahydrodipicolinate reductase [Verrucomicrobiota bacterium]